MRIGRPRTLTFGLGFLALLPLGAGACSRVTGAPALAEPGAKAAPQPARPVARPTLTLDAGAVQPIGLATSHGPDTTGRPVCARVGTRSEGWAWPSGRFIRWSKCKGVVPKCESGGPGEVEGWYAQGTLIAADPCAKGGGKQR